ncbi:MAG: putative membrane protein [Idiomarinaceae bacterium HL-53]|nr:MAG: putative membrane protein [Idiomarinaceae bacterium HL-53]CUS48526.1 hypothetical protein Ga0003345_1484 [Idiomarinaceae bacterium HL-53]
MNIQIGLNCEPAWLCDAVGGALALIVVVGLLLFVRRLFREWKNQQRK